MRYGRARDVGADGDHDRDVLRDPVVEYEAIADRIVAGHDNGLREPGDIPSEDRRYLPSERSDVPEPLEAESGTTESLLIVAVLTDLDSRSGTIEASATDAYVGHIFDEKHEAAHVIAPPKTSLPGCEVALSEEHVPGGGPAAAG